MDRICRFGTKTHFKAVTHVIFDMDGVLLDTETLYTQATQNILDQYGKKYTPDIKIQMMGLHGTEVAKAIVQIYDLPITPEEYIQQALTQLNILMPDAKLMPGIEKIILHLKYHSIPMAVATSSSLESYDIKAKNHICFFSHFDHKVFGGSDPEVKTGKPSPDIFLVCASRFTAKPSPEKCLVLEDSPNGVTAAISAGMQCVMIPDKAVVTPELTKHATLVLDSLDDFQPELFGLPSYSDMP